MVEAQSGAITNKVPVEIKTGPAIGEKVPDFTLPDQQGQPRALKDMLGPNGALVNFYRSASW